MIESGARVKGVLARELDVNPGRQVASPEQWSTCFIELA
jgi:hypothetical protein